MPRRSADESPFEEFIGAFAQLPAIAGLITAAVFFAIGLLLPFIADSGIGGAFAQTGRNVLWFLAIVVAIVTTAGAIRRRLDRRPSIQL